MNLFNGSWDFDNTPHSKYIGFRPSPEFLHLTQNNFEGPLPDLFERLTNLREIYIGKNHFTGTLPETIGQISNVSKSAVCRAFYCYLGMGLF